MAKGGGGSWKVAYADFVTAMMAFFLVMWIGSQDQKTRQSVANYFIDPSGVDKRPAKAGAVLPTPNYGNVPDEQSSAMSKGRDAVTKADGEHSPATKLVSDWLHHDKRLWQRWQDRARQAVAAANGSPEVVKQHLPVETVAAREIAKQLQQELKGGLADKADGVYRDLLFWTMSEVNWGQLAEDLLAK